jgi:hypothetical protein
MDVDTLSGIQDFDTVIPAGANSKIAMLQAKGLSLDSSPH